MKNTKKGFTLVELLVVIAIVAILATVAIIGYTSFMKKADLSNDQSAIAQMNTALQASAVPNGFANPSDAIDALYNVGWNLGKMQPYSNGYHYAYSHADNKMYLLDENDNVVYPEETDKSKLWGFYYDSVEGKLGGVTNYIAMTHITNAVNFAQAFGNGNYNIDLNGYSFDIGDGAGNPNVTIDNGAYVSGNVAKDESVKDYVIATTIEKVEGKKYEFTVFKNQQFNASVAMSFENCIFYNCALVFSNNVDFVNCEFIGGYSNSLPVIETRANKEGAFTINITNCLFNNVTRGINITNGEYPNTNTREINISGCEFTGATVEKYLIQYAAQNSKLNVTNCQFTSLGVAPAIIRFHENMEVVGNYASLADNVTFTNNKISSDIAVDKYVDTDGVTTNAAATLDTAMTNKMK